MRLVITHNKEACDEEFQLFTETGMHIDAIVLDLSDAEEETFHKFDLPQEVDWSDYDHPGRRWVRCWSHTLDIQKVPEFVQSVFEEYDGNTYVAEEDEVIDG